MKLEKFSAVVNATWSASEEGMKTRGTHIPVGADSGKVVYNMGLSKATADQRGIKPCQKQKCLPQKKRNC